MNTLTLVRKLIGLAALVTFVVNAVQYVLQLIHPQWVDSVSYIKLSDTVQPIITICPLGNCMLLKFWVFCRPFLMVLGC